MQSKKRPIWAMLLLLLCLFGSGCLERFRPGGAGGSESETVRDGDYGGVFRGVLTGDPQTLDPAYITDVRDGALAALLYNGLVRYGADNLELVSDLADWEVTKDGKTYTFKIKPGAKFSNGREVTAEDFAYSFKRIINPATRSPRSWVLGGIAGANEYAAGLSDTVAGIKVPSRHTLEITLEKPYASFLSQLAMPAAYVVPKEEVERSGDFGRNPVGTGPFILSDWQEGEYLSFAANPDYFAERPYLDGIDYSIIYDSRSYTAQFARGELDAIPLDTAEGAADPDNNAVLGEISERPDLSIFYLALNCRKAPFNDIRVRQAVNYAINRPRLLSLFGSESGILAKGPIPRTVAGYNANLAGYEYNPAKAKSLLAEAGIAAGTKIRLWQSKSGSILRLTRAVQEDLRAVGLQVEIVQGKWSDMGQDLENKSADAAYLSWWADYPDAENFLFPVFHSANAGAKGNRAGYKNSAVDAAIDAARITTSEPERLVQYAELEKTIVEEAPWVFLWHSKSRYLLQPWVRDYHLHSLYNGNKMTDVWLDAALRPQ
jgi:ABC-type transport system substrate-binding protein